MHIRGMYDSEYVVSEYYYYVVVVWMDGHVRPTPRILQKSLK